MDTLALAGRRILITRAAADLAALAARVRLRGAEPVPFPCIEFAAPDAPAQAALDASIARLLREPPAALALASPQAVERFLAQLQAHRLDPIAALRGVPIGAAGEGTARALAAHGLASFQPRDGDGVGAAPLARAIAERLRPAQSGAPLRVLIPQPAEATPQLALALRKAQLEVEEAIVYRTLPLRAATPEHAAGLALLRAGQIDAIAFASGSAVRGFVQLLDAERALAARARIACIGESTAAVARALGFEVSAVGASGFDAMLDALAACYPANDPL